MENKQVLTKMLKGMLDLIILKLLEGQPMHGYAFISTIRRQFGVYFGPSTIYPLLNALEKKGYVESEWKFYSDRPQKVYKITSEGRAFLDETERGLSIIVRPLLATTVHSA